MTRSRAPLPFPFVIGHRGSPKAAPENTLASFRQAAREGATWVEFDVSLTRDGRAVIFHDDELSRTSDGEGLLADTPFAAVRDLDAGSWFGSAFAGETIPTLEEALDLFAELNLAFNMEIKPDRGREVETAEVALAIARDCWPADAPPPLVSSFSRAAVAAAKEIRPEWPRDLLFDRVPEDWAAAGRQLDVISFGASQRHLTAEQVAVMHAAGYGVMAYTVNEIDRAKTLRSWGVDAIFTDVPGTMLTAFAT